MVVSLLLGLMSGTISFENPGIRLELFLKEMSKQSGQGFHCPVYLNNEVLTASFKDQSIDVLKSQLARVIHGTWEQKEDGWWLVQTGDQKKEELSWHREMRRTFIQQLIDWGKANLPTKEWTIKEAELYERQTKEMRKPTGEHRITAAERRVIMSRSAENRFGASLIAQLKPEMFPLDSLEEDYQFYSVNGAPIGHDLPINVDNSLAMMDREIALSGLVGDQFVPDSHAKRVLISIPNRFPMFPDMAVYDQYWKFVAIPYPWLFNSRARLIGESFPLSDYLTTFFEAVRLGVPGGPDEEGTSRSSAKYKSIWDHIRAVFLDAPNQDPLGILQGRCWIDFSHSVKQPMLVSLCDDNTTDPKYSVPAVQQTQTVINVTRDDHDGWVLGRPANPLWNRTHRIDRYLIQQVARLRQKSDKELTIEECGIVADITGFADTYCAGIPNDRYLQNLNMSSGMGGDSNILLEIFGATIRAGIKPNLRTGIIDQAALPSWARGYLLAKYMEGSFSQFIPENKKDLCPQYCFPNGIQGMYFKIEPSIEPIFEIKDSEIGAYKASLDDFAAVVKDCLEKRFPLELIPFKLGAVRHLELSLCLGDKAMQTSVEDPPLSALRASNWQSLDPLLKQRILQKVKELDQEIPPRK